MSNGRVLIVDRDAQMLAWSCTVLRRAGFETWPASRCAADVLSVLEAEPDVVVMDACTSCVHAASWQRELRASCGIGRVPVVLFTARARTEDLQCAFVAGVEKYLVKPCEPHELVLAVEELVQRRHATLAG
jgi:DNA-binding response OmpR family regulator